MAEDAQAVREFRKFAERRRERWVARLHLKIKVEAVFPGAAGQRAALDFRQIDFAPGEGGDGFGKRPRAMGEAEDQGELGAVTFKGDWPRAEMPRKTSAL